MLCNSFLVNLTNNKTVHEEMKLDVFFPYRCCFSELIHRFTCSVIHNIIFYIWSLMITPNCIHYFLPLHYFPPCPRWLHAPLTYTNLMATSRSSQFSFSQYIPYFSAQLIPLATCTVTGFKHCKHHCRLINFAQLIAVCQWQMCN